MSDKLSEDKTLSACALEMKNLVCALAGQRGWNETRSRWIERAARRAGITYRMARALFYMEIRDPRASVVERLRNAAQRKCINDVASAQDLYREAIERIATLERTIAEMDANARGAVGAACCGMGAVLLGGFSTNDCALGDGGERRK